MAVNRAARRCAALSHIVIRARMSTMTMPKTTYGAAEWLSRRQARTVATSRSQTMETGMRTFQPIADALKLPLKEDIIPRSSDKLVFIAAPLISATCAFVGFAIIPVSIVWLLLVASVRAWRLDSHSTAPYVVFGIVIVLILALITMWDSAAQQRAARYSAMAQASAEEAEAAERAGVTAPAAAAATAFPVPPLDLPHYHGVATGNQTSTREVTGA